MEGKKCCDEQGDNHGEGKRKIADLLNRVPHVHDHGDPEIVIGGDEAV